MSSGTIHHDDEATPNAQPDAPRIRLKNVEKRFDGQVVLRELNTEFRPGKVTVVLGPSGSGKSVMLKHIIGLLKPDAGEVWFGETRVDTLNERQMAAVRKRIGFLFQMGALFDSMNVQQNVEFPLQEHTKLSAAERRERVEAMLETVGLPNILHKMPAELSGGQRKRVALARAIVLEPTAILYDEPTTGLDPIRSDVINELILKLQDALHTTSIVVTHDLTSAFKVADHLILLHAGRVQLEGTAEDFRRSDDPIVQRFLRGEAEPPELERINRSGLRHRSRRRAAS